MPRSANPLVAQIRALETMVKTDRKARRAAEAPIKRARRELIERVRRTVRSADRYNQIIADELNYKGRGFFCNDVKIRDAEASLAKTTAAYKLRLETLTAFDAEHGLKVQDYPRLPELDREATIAAGKAEQAQAMAEWRARKQRPPPPPTTPGAFADMPDPEDNLP